MKKEAKKGVLSRAFLKFVKVYKNEGDFFRKKV